MVTILKTWSHQYSWLHNTISRLVSLSVEGERKFFYLTIENVPLKSDTKILDLCYGGGKATNFFSTKTTRLNVLLTPLYQTVKAVFEANYFGERAKQMPFAQFKFG
ncbi:hypothetical protein [cyanobacterium endosymbiont of Epithemia turgida]|uniref:hypothetical protein n=1 Tax=cyanobacterium endosymbiont of Epithemia turgida TaxID=718217 RepID=UPI0006989B5B|nr:hypothetical protein [cyanobacterium endosymbiont of Epithemia turgida]